VPLSGLTASFPASPTALNLRKVSAKTPLNHNILADTFLFSSSLKYKGATIRLGGVLYPYHEERLYGTTPSLANLLIRKFQKYLA
jgi:hypothetical protein